jgi:hypothetical protein
MKKLFIFLGLIFIWNIIQAQTNELIPSDFGVQASLHVKTICGFGKRTAGSIAEQKTIDYLIEEFTKNNMDVKIDTFRNNYYKLQNRAFFINDVEIKLKSAFIDHTLKDTLEFESYCLKLDSTVNMDSLQDKVVLTSSSINSVVLTNNKPKSVMVIDPYVFDTLAIDVNKKYTFKFIGTINSDWIESYNIIATYNHTYPVDSTIIVSAHWDSDPGVGAGDNASGTAALIELSRFFSKKLSNLKYNLIFLCSGSHEHDMIGITSYILNHYGSLDNCIINLNIDDISYLKPYIETSYFRSEMSYTDTLQLLSIVSLKNSQGNLFTSFREIYGNRPETPVSVKWIRKKYEKSMSELKVNYQDAGCCSGSDSNAFAYLGIPYIFFSSIPLDEKTDNANTINDVYYDYFIPNIQLSGQIISKIINDFNK